MIVKCLALRSEGLSSNSSKGKKLTKYSISESVLDKVFISLPESLYEIRHKNPISTCNCNMKLRQIYKK